MSIYCGTDIIEIERVKSSIEKLGESFLNKVYTKKEIEYCESKGNQKYQHYAARFAAKEATFKAISTIIDDKYDVNWTDFEVENESSGRPKVNILNGKYNKFIDEINISISHCKDYAIANVVCNLK